MIIFIDIDECVVYGCLDRCNNTAGGFYCLCFSGNGLLVDKKTC